jgi:hypothetical protein
MLLYGIQVPYRATNNLDGPGPLHVDQAQWARNTIADGNPFRLRVNRVNNED